ncbi:MAG: cadherin-like domain-containing protein, partial [Hyphomicrobiales bacterium]
MSTDKTTGSDVQAKPTDGNGSAKDSNRLSDDAHDFVLKDAPVDGANQNLGNAHEGNYSFAARMGNSLDSGTGAAKVMNDPRPFSESSSSMSFEDPNGLETNAAPAVERNHIQTQTLSPEELNTGAPSVNTLFSSTGPVVSTPDSQNSILTDTSPKSSNPDAFTGNNSAPSDPTPTTTLGTGTGGGNDQNNSAPEELAWFGTSTDEDTSQIITQEMLLANFQDADGDTLTAINLTVDGGTLTDNDNGTWTFAPDQDFNGDISVTFDVSDGQSVTPGSGTIIVNPINDGPVAGNVDLGATAEDTSVTFSEADLLANSSDIDGDSLSVTSVSVSASFGTLTDNEDGT